MTIIIFAILPIILLLILGNFIRRRGFVPKEFWAASDKLTYFIFLPTWLITKISQVDFSKIDFSLFLLFILLYFLLLSMLSWIIYRVTRAKPNQFSSMYQGLLRFNGYIYFAIIDAIWGHGYLVLSALIAGFIIPLINICCVASFSVGSGDFSLLKTIKTIIRNPLIIGTLLGFIGNIFPSLLPKVLFDTLMILSKVALPLALLSVGAAIHIKMLFISSDGFSRSLLWINSLARLIIVPAIALLITYLLGIGGEVRMILVIFAAVPTATSSYILSKQLKGDAQLMAATISLQMVLSIITLIFWLSILI